jgi:protein-S-isoprenylcysteine O-methyltransferase Ste14
MTLAYSTPTPFVAPQASPLARGATLAYGLVVYLLFLGVFLYTIGFVEGFGVPVTVDGGRAAPLAEALLVNGGILALFAVQHTVMARSAFKRVWTRIIPPAIERSTFVLATSLILVALFAQWRALPGVVWALEGPAAWILRAISFAGFGIVLVSTFLIDHFALFGLAQVVRYFRGTQAPEARFEERWFYRYVRHPLMLGFLIAFWATPVMSYGHLFFAVMVTGYILVGTHIEERTLVAEHGESYRAYRRRVPMFLPRIRTSHQG